MAASKAELKLTGLETGIKSTTAEIGRIEQIIASVDNEIESASAAIAALATETAETTKRSDMLHGQLEIGKTDTGLKAELRKISDKLISLGSSRQSLPNIDDLRTKKRRITAALAVEKARLNEMELSYPEAVRALNIEKASAELVIFMGLTEKIAESITKLALIDEDLGDNTIFYSGSPFVLPTPLLEPFHATAEVLRYHQESARGCLLTDMLRNQIVTAGGQQWRE